MMQLLKGGFSYRVKNELNLLFSVWQRGFSDHRIRDDFAVHRIYIHQNPVKARLVKSAEEFEFSSASGKWAQDAVPHLGG